MNTRIYLDYVKINNYTQNLCINPILTGSCCNDIGNCKIIIILRY